MNETPVRLRRLFDSRSAKALLLSFTSGMELGVRRDLADVGQVVTQLTEIAPVTGVVVHSGVANSLFQQAPQLPCGVIVDLFGGTWMTTQPYRRERICSLEEAVRVGADAALATLGLGSPDESRQLRLLGDITRECAAWGLPLVLRIDTTETDARRQFSATLCGHGVRLAYEIGAHAAVVNYPGDEQLFAEAIRGADLPVLFGGAPQLATDELLLGSLGAALSGGAAGCCLPGGLFWADGPSPALSQVAKLIHAR